MNKEKNRYEQNLFHNKVEDEIEKNYSKFTEGMTYEQNRDIAMKLLGAHSNKKNRYE